MFLDLALGPLTEPITGTHWDRDMVRARYRRRLAFFGRHGLSAGDRVCLHYGNTPEFFVDLIAIWSLGGCAIPIDTRLTAFEIETLLRAAAPRFSLWFGPPDAGLARMARADGIEYSDLIRMIVERALSVSRDHVPASDDRWQLTQRLSGVQGGW